MISWIQFTFCLSSLKCMSITDLSDLFKWDNLQNMWLTNTSCPSVHRFMFSWLNAVCGRWHILFLFLCQFKQTHKLSLLWLLIANCYWNYLVPSSPLSAIRITEFYQTTCHVGQVSYFSPFLHKEQDVQYISGRIQRSWGSFWQCQMARSSGASLSSPPAPLPSCRDTWPWRANLSLWEDQARDMFARTSACADPSVTANPPSLSVAFCDVLLNKPLRDRFSNGLSVPLELKRS